MKKLELTTKNKSYIVQKYVDDIAYRMDDNEIYDAFKDYFYKEKMSYPIDTLRAEIQLHCPEILDHNFLEQVIAKGTYHAKAV